MQNNPQFDRLMVILPTLVGLLVIFYFVVFVLVNPTPLLVSAVSVEIAVFLGAIFFRYFAGKIFKAKPAERVSKKPGLLRLLLVSGWAAVFTLLLIDFSGMAAAFLRNYSLSSQIYCAVPTSSLIGQHPATSLEVLTGAYVEAKQYDRAEPLYLTVLAIRQQYYGDKSDTVAALYADLGDLAVKKGNKNKAEYWYRRSLSITDGYGRALLHLANVLRDNGKPAEASIYYRKAIAVKTRIYGNKSAKVAEARYEYAKLLKGS
jgi:tetratricopeptide (TPR) repeat protein